MCEKETTSTIVRVNDVVIGNISIHNLFPVVMWKWNCKITHCSICKISFDEPGVGLNSLGDEIGNSDYSVYTTIWESICGHSYHRDCIEKWLRIRNVCPLCNETWKLSKIRNGEDESPEMER